MTPRTVRAIVVAVFVGGIVGMIVSSIADNNGAALTFGLLTAVAAVCLIVVTAVVTSDATDETADFDEEAAADLERRIQALMAQGASEDDVRDLVRASVSLGRSAAVHRPRTNLSRGDLE